MIHLWNDLLLAARELRRRPRVSLAMLATLSLAIGLTVATFSIVRALVLGDAPVRDPDQVWALYTVDDVNPGHMPVSDPTAFDVAGQLATEQLGELTLLAGVTATVQTPGGTEPRRTVIVTSNYFEVLGVRPQLGRFFDAVDHGAPVLEVVLSDRTWREAFDGDPLVLGRSLTVEDRALTIIGVAPPGFVGTTMLEAELFLPYAAHSEVLPSLPWFGHRRFLAFDALVRLAPRVTPEQLHTRVAAIAETIAQAHPDEVGGRRLRAVPLAHALLGPDARSALVLAAGIGMTAAGFVLLVACANAASLLITRASPLRTELALRGALGATPWRLFRQVVSTASLLAAGAGAVGLCLAPWIRDLLWWLRPPMLWGMSLRPALDPGVLWFAIAISAATALSFGLVPAIGAARVDLASPLRHHASHGQATHRGLRATLVVFQIAVSFTALLGAALFVRGAARALAIDPGFAVHELAAIEIDAGGADGHPGDDLAQLQQRLAAVRAQPGVVEAELATALPFGANEFRRTVSTDPTGDKPAPPPRLVTTAAVGPRLFATLGLALLEGRNFAASDGIDAERVAIVNQAFVDAWWPEGDACDRRLHLAGVEKPLRVVGVVATSKWMALDEPDLPVLWLPLVQWPQPSLQLVARGPDAEQTLTSLRAALEQDLGHATMSRPRTLATDVEATLGGMHAAARLLGLFGAVAIALAIVGMHAVMTDAVRQQTRELGIRMALGATPAVVRTMVMREALGLALVGNAIGIVLGLGLQHLLAEHLYEVPAGDVFAFGGVAALVTMAAMLATWLPARAATRIEPARAIDRG